MSFLKRTGPTIIPFSDPQASVQDKREKYDREVAALWQELRHYERYGMTDSIKEVHAELERLGVGIRRDK